METVLETKTSGQALTMMPSLEFEVGTEDVRLILLPPGIVNATFKLDCHIVDVNLNAIDHKIALDSDKLKLFQVPADSLGYWPKGSEVTLQVANTLPGCVLEVSDRAMNSWLDEANIAPKYRHDAIFYQNDPVAADLGRAAITYLASLGSNKQPTDKLTIESLGLSIASRAIARFHACSQDPDAEVSSWHQRSCERRIQCAVDYINSNISDPSLSISEIASAASLSSAHFGVVFKAATGQSPYAYILERRAKYARDLVCGTRQALADIAYQSGFSSQAHMTTIMKRCFGITPGSLR